MLTTMRDKLSGWITWVIIGAIIMVFLLFGVGNYFGSGGGGQQEVARVGDQPITRSELTMAVRQAQSRNPQADQTALRQQVLQQLVREKRLMVAARDLGLRMSDQQVDQLIVQVPAFQQDGSFSRQRFKRYLRASGLSLSDLRQKLREGALSNQLLRGVAGSDFVLPSEQQDYNRLMNQQRSIQLKRFPASRFMDKVTVSEQQVKDYYHQHPDAFTEPEKVRLDYIELSVDSIAEHIKLSGDKLHKYYQAHKQSFSTPAKRHYAQLTLALPDDASKQQIKALHHKAEKIARKAREGADFSKLVKEYSTDALARKNGGDMGWIASDQASGAVQQKVFALNKAGAVSEPVKNKHGFQIVKLVDKKPAETRPFDQVKDRIATTMKKQQARREYSTLGNQLANMAFENPQSLSYVARQLDLPVRHTGMFSRQGTQKGLASHDKVVKAAFSDNVLKEQRNSEVINLGKDHAVVLHLASHKPPERKPLDAVRQQIRQRLKKQKAIEQAGKKAESLAVRLNTEKQQEAAPESFSELKHISRQDKRLPAAGVKAVMNAPYSSKDSKQWSVARLHNGYAAFAVNNVSVPGSDSVQNQRAGLILGNMNQLLVKESYMQLLEKRIPAHIDDND